MDISYQLIGDPTIAGLGNGNHTDMSSFQQNHKKVYEGRGLAIVRSNGTKGKVILKASANGLKDGTFAIEMK